MRIRVLPVVGAATLALSVASSASAAWSVGGVGAARADAAVLAAPAPLSVAWDPVVHLSWAQTASGWASGYRVYRSITPGGPYTELADLPGVGTTTMDDTPGAGTFYYSVRAYHEGWASAHSNEVARKDPTYVFQSTTGFTATNCTAGSGGTADMQQGDAAGGPESSGSLKGKTYGFCSNTFISGQRLPAGTTTVTAYLDNLSTFATCGVTLSLSVNDGAVALGSASVGVPPSQRKTSSLTWSFATAGASFATGDRLSLLISPQSNSCNFTTLYWNGTATPSSLTLTE